MDQLERDLTEAMKVSVEQMELSGLTRVKRAVLVNLSACRSRRRSGVARFRIGAAAFMGGVACIVGGVLVANAISAPTRPPIAGSKLPGGAQFVPPSHAPGQPCADAKSTTLSALGALTNVPVWMPATPVASEKTLSGVWMCGPTPTLMFGKVVVAFEPGWNIADPADRWSKMAKQWGRGYVGTALGRPAFIEPVSKMATRGEVLVIVNDTLVRIGGDGEVTASQLLAIADSLDLDRSLTATSHSTSRQ